ncbi:MAG: hypothetical protein IPH44_18395 [Myxococcales bacterium]|jgi:hypothetical protein|nr:hypothetical protein [Myxococcales bacterium]
MSRSKRNTPQHTAGQVAACAYLRTTPPVSPLRDDVDGGLAPPDATTLEGVDTSTTSATQVVSFAHRRRSLTLLRGR